MKISDKKIKQLTEDMQFNGSEEFDTEGVVVDTAYKIMKGFGYECADLDLLTIEGINDKDNGVSLYEFVEKFWDEAIKLFFNFIVSE